MIEHQVRNVNKMFPVIPPATIHRVQAPVDNAVMPENNTADIPRQILERLIVARQQTGVARSGVISALAKRCDCTRELIYMMLRGQRRITDDKIQCMADYFGVQPHYLKYGVQSLDPDSVAETLIDVLHVLIDEGVIKSSVTAEQLGFFLAENCADSAAQNGELDYKKIRRYIRLIDPAAGRTKQ